MFAGLTVTVLPARTVVLPLLVTIGLCDDITTDVPGFCCAMVVVVVVVTTAAVDKECAVVIISARDVILRAISSGLIFVVVISGVLLS